jgi:hypothetical protein
MLSRKSGGISGIQSHIRPDILCIPSKDMLINILFNCCSVSGRTVTSGMWSGAMHRNSTGTWPGNTSSDAPDIRYPAG